MNDYDVIHKAIIESNGCKEDSFPYEYEVINFTVDVKAEDWTIEEGEASCNIVLEVPIPLQYTNMIWGVLNNLTPNSIDNRDFPIRIAGLDLLVSVGLNDDEITNIDIYGTYEETFTPPENLKLEFQNLIFV